MALRIEFTVEPFIDGAPGPHVHAAVEAARAAGSTSTSGRSGARSRVPTMQVLAAADAVARAAIGRGRDPGLDADHRPADPGRSAPFTERPVHRAFTARH